VTEKNYSLLETPLTENDATTPTVISAGPGSDGILPASCSEDVATEAKEADLSNEQDAAVPGNSPPYPPFFSFWLPRSFEKSELGLWDHDIFASSVYGYDSENSHSLPYIGPCC
jgi:hypothetical protein